MIIEYHRPKSIQEALTLLAREHPLSYALGGGTILNQGKKIDYAVVDLQSIGLDSIKSKGNVSQVGASVTLQTLLLQEGLLEDLYKTIRFEATYNLRQMATVAGTIVASDGRSPFTTAMLAMDAGMEVHKLDKKPKFIKLGDWLPLRSEADKGSLITTFSIPTNVRFTYESIARSPADRPIVCAAVCQWSSGRTRLALGGWGTSPILAMDGPNSDGIDIAGRESYSSAGDQWASADYRQEMAGILALRCLERLNLG